MNNNYVQKLVLSEQNNKLIIYFKSNIYSCIKEQITKSNFKLFLISQNLYTNINIIDILKNDVNSYTIFFKLNENYLDNNSVIVFELINVYDYNHKLLSNYQKNNKTFVNYNNQTKPYNMKSKNNNIFKKHTYFNYITKSSPQLAYQANVKINNIININNYNNFYGKKINKYPSSYYSTTYSKMFKPILDISPLK